MFRDAIFLTEGFMLAQLFLDMLSGKFMEVLEVNLKIRRVSSMSVII